jgi:hypothetical protein
MITDHTERPLMEAIESMGIYLSTIVISLVGLLLDSGINQ